MVMKALRDGAKGGIGKFILFGFLVLAVGGLVLTDVGGFFRGGTGSNNVIKVAGETVSIQKFDRAARRQLAPTGLSTEDAYKIGYMQQIIGAQIREVLMHKLSRQSDIYISQDDIAKHIAKLLLPMTQSGQSPDAVLQQILRAQGMSEREFAAAIQYEMKNALITGTLKSATTAISPHMVDALYQYQNETRTVEYLKFYDTEMDVGEPSDEDLKAIYDATKSRYTIPETRTIDIIQIDSAAIKDTIVFSDEELQSYYDDNQSSFQKAETRVIQQALFDDEESANKVASEAQQGVDLKEAVETITGSPVAYLGEETITEDSLLDALKAPVQDAKKGDIIGPIQTPLGYSVITVKSITEAQSTSFKDAKADIKSLLAEEELIDQTYVIADEIEDMLASGANAASVKDTHPVTITTIENLSSFGQSTLTKKSTLDAFGEDLRTLTATAFDLEEGETSPLSELESGQLTAVHIAAIQPQGLHPFEEVKSQLESHWTKDKQHAENRARAAEFFALTQTGEKTLKQIADEKTRTHRTAKKLKRDNPQAPFNKPATAVIFGGSKNTPAITQIDGGLAIITITDISLPSVTDKTRSGKTYKALQDELLLSAQNETLQIILENLHKKSPAKINDRLLARTYGGNQGQ